jgi:hypothetical protein
MPTGSAPDDVSVGGVVTAKTKGKRRLIKGLAIAGGLMIALPTIAWYSAPTFIKWYAPRKVPGLTIDDIDLHLDGTAEAQGVHLEREGASAHFDKIHINLKTKDASIQGGNVKLNIDKFKSPDKESSSKSKKQWNVVALDIDIHVTKKDLVADIYQASFDRKHICFESVTVKHPKFIRININKGCVDKSKIGDFQRIELEIKLPIKIPHVKEHQHILVENVNFDYPSKAFSFGNATFTNHGEKKKHSGLTVGNVKINDRVISVAVDSLETNHRWLSPNPDSNYPWGVTKVSLTYPRKRGTIVFGAQSWRGGLVEILIDRNPWNISSQDGRCADWLSVGTAHASEPDNYDGMSGVFGFDVGIKPPKLKITNKCKMSCGDDIIKGLKSRFKYMAVNEKGEPFERETGPRSKNWTPLTGVASELHEAVVMLEDPGFEWHKGYLRLALFNSLKINLEAGKFARGGSTITMQLVKNIWLGRAKTLDRKLREIILAKMLEGCLSKYEIIELYLNVVEFAPNVYGIGAASRHYFEKNAGLLEPDEAMFLAMALPRPSRVVHPKDGGMKPVHRFMKRWKEMDKLPEEFHLGLGLNDTKTGNDETAVEGDGIKTEVRKK